MKKVICVLVVMLLAVHASAVVWTGPSTVSGTTAGDGTWGDINNWVEDFAGWPADPPPAATPVITAASALPSSTDNVWLLGGLSPEGYGVGDWGPRVLDPAFDGGPVAINAPGAQAGNLYVGYWGYSSTLNVASTGTLDVAGFMAIGHAANECYVNNEGAITVGSDLWIGHKWNMGPGALNNYGTIDVGGNLNFNTKAEWGANPFNMYGGTVNVAGILDLSWGEYNHMQLDGGTVEAAGLKFDAWYQDTVDITDGTLILDGDWTGEVVWNPATGQPDQNSSWGLAWWTAEVPFEEGAWTHTLMTAYGGAGTVMYEYDGTAGQTTIWAEIPEPATMSLLGLGAVALLRRRK